MHISELSIRRPVFAWMLMAAMILFGGIGFLQMGVSAYPDVDFPNVSIRLEFPGAAPEVIEKDVIDPVEGAVVSIQGIKRISSESRNGAGSVSVEFELSKDIDVAVQEVQTAIARAQRNLPDDLEAPVVTKSNIEDQPILWLSVRSNKLSRKELMVLVREKVRDQFSTVEGVSEIILGGYVDPALRVDVGADVLARFQLSVNDVINSIQNEHKEEPAGRIESPITEQPVRVMGEAQNVEEFRKVVIQRRGGGPNYNPIAISSVAEIYEGLGDVRRLSRVNGESAVGVGIRKQRGSNAVQVGKAVKAKALEVKKILPEGVDIAVNYDSTPFIEETVNELLFTIILAALFTSFVCWIFLGSWSSTFNVLLAIPTSIIGTFFVMQSLGFTLNTFSLLGLSLAIGIVVDDAIIVLENITRHRELGENRLIGAVKGSKEISFAVIATTASLVAIFLPVAFLQGIIGKFFFQFAVTLSVAVLLSSVEALTLAPMRCSQFLSIEPRRGWIGVRFEAGMKKLGDIYAGYLPIVLEHRWKTLGLTMLFFVATLMLLPKVPKEFTPSQDEGRLFIRVKTDQGSSLEFTSEKTKEIEKIISNNPSVERYFCAIGGFGGGESNTAFLFVTLKDFKERSKSQDEIVEELRADLKKVEGAKAFIPSGGSSFLGGGRSYAVSFGVRGANWDRLVGLSGEIEKAMTASGKFSDVNLPDISGSPEIHIVPDRQRALRMGVEVSEISRAVRVLVGGFSAALYSKGGQRYDVIVQLKEADRKSLGQIKKILVRNTRGELISLDQVVRFEEKKTPPTITREDRVRSITVSANAAKGVSQEDALKEAQVIVDKLLPENYFIAWSGTAETFKESTQSLIFALILGILVSYMVLGTQFNSFKDPIVVLAALPFALSGAIIGLLVFGQSLNVFSFIGIILLVGIVMKNSILLVDFTNQLREKGQSIHAALVEACPLRLRPILMTTASTLAAALPGALNFGPGAESRIPMSVVIIGGVIVSTVFTLFVVPCLYSLIAGDRYDMDRRLDEHQKTARA